MRRLAARGNPQEYRADRLRWAAGAGPRRLWLGGGRDVARSVSGPESRSGMGARSGGGATVATSYKLFIVPTGRTPTRGHERLLAEDVSNLKITWREPKRLEPSYERARIYRFFNYWHDR